MQVIGVALPIIKPGDNLPEMILIAADKVGGLRDGDVLVISSKIVATSQGRIKELSRIKPSTRAKKIAVRSGQAPEFVELVLHEADKVLRVCKGAILTIKEGLICANAGADLSNAPRGQTILMPAKPDTAAEALRKALSEGSGAKIGVVISDSVVRPLRLGTVGQAIGVAGIEPVIDCRGQPDIYGRPLKITFRAIADQLATAAELVMGEANEKIPVVIVRDAVVEFVEKPKHSAKISQKQCIYYGGMDI